MNTELETALSAINRQDYAEAVKLLHPLAEAGHATAQSNLGTLYQLGLGVPRDLPEGVRWLKLAVEQGDGAAAHNLGTIYLTGSHEIPIDMVASKEWYRKARELGFEAADSKWYE
ncbi:MAG: tetratricopeptide repeat protein [Candidatus Binatia bacterium]